MDENKKAPKEPRKRKNEIRIEILAPLAFIIALISLMVAVLNLLMK